MEGEVLQSLLAEVAAEDHRVPQTQEVAEAAELTLQGDQEVEVVALQVQQNLAREGEVVVLMGHHDPVQAEAGAGALQVPRGLEEVVERQVPWEAEAEVLLQ